MSVEARPKLAIRAIVVTTRAAVTSNRNSGDEELARRSAERGLELLHELRPRLRPEQGDGVAEAYEEAQRELTSLRADEQVRSRCGSATEW